MELKKESCLTEVRPGRRIYMRENKDISADDKKETTIFFIHGSMASFKQFDSLIQEYEQHFNVVAYDALGCGRSDKPADPLIWGESHYTCNNLLLDFIEIWQRFSTAKNIIIGHSFGTALAAKFYRYLVAKLETDISQLLGTILLGTTSSLPSGGHPIFYLPVWILDLMQESLSKSFAELAFSQNTDSKIISTSRQTSSQNKMYVCKSFYSNFVWADEDD